MGVSAEIRAANARIILDVLAARGGDGRVLRTIAGRESGLNHAIRHELDADADGSIAAWKRNRNRYATNPYYDDVALWNHGKGLFGMMPANHLFRWDPTANPDVLFNPYVASVVAARLVRRCMQIGAETWADVDQCWATGKPRRSDSWGPRRQRMIARLSDLGYPTSLVDDTPNPGDWGTEPQPDQTEWLWFISGKSQPSIFNTDPTPAVARTFSPKLAIGVALASLGSLALFSRVTSRRTS